MLATKMARLFKKRLSFYIERHAFDHGPFDWVDCVPHIEAAQNNCWYPHMASTPFEMRFGHKMPHPLDNFLEFLRPAETDSKDLRIYKEKLTVRKFQLLEDYNSSFLKYKKQYLQQANKNRVSQKFETGDCVMVDVSGRLTGNAAHSVARYEGPFVVLQEIHNLSLIHI